MIGFTGSRSITKAQVKKVQSIVKAVMSKGLPVATGCAYGVDEAVRYVDPSITVFRVNSGEWGRGKSAYARRSTAMVKSLIGTERCGLVGFPTSECPVGVEPAREWRSGKPPSGTWSTIALAYGLNIPVVVFPLDGVKLPNWKGVQWIETAEWSGGFRCAPSQTSLF